MLLNDYVSKYDLYKSAALTGLLSGIYFDSKDAQEVTEDDLNYLDKLCSRIASKMIDKT